MLDEERTFLRLQTNDRKGDGKGNVGRERKRERENTKRKL